MSRALIDADVGSFSLVAKSCKVVVLDLSVAIFLPFWRLCKFRRFGQQLPWRNGQDQSGIDLEWCRVWVRFYGPQSARRNIHLVGDSLASVQDV